MSDINSHMKKIDTSMSLLLSSINNLQKVVEDDNEKTGSNKIQAEGEVMAM